MSASSTESFGKLRAFFWPIHSFELKKVLPMFLMFFLISFNYSVLRNVKDTLIVTAPSSGAETILFLKFWGVLPCAVIFTIIYAKLSNILSKQKLFYSVVGFFLAFFVIFAAFLYPNREALHPNELADTLTQTLPGGFKGLIAIFRNWTFSAFYILAELWGSFLLSLMFWGFANEITRVNEAKRFYTLFGIGANLALLCSGGVTIFLSRLGQRVPEGVDPWGITLNLLVCMVLLGGAGIITLYWWINRYVLTDERFYSATEQVNKKKQKPKLSLKQSFLHLVKSPYMGLLAILVIAYGVSINIVEVTWKNQLKLQFPQSNDYSAFMGYFSSLTGLLTVLMMLFVGGNVMRRYGWKTAALITPIVLLITGVLFFSLVMFKGTLTGILATLGTTPLMLAVVVGTFQNAMTKSSKYSLFDPTKEMAYIPLDQEQKVKGKAAVDIIGARLGKSGGTLIQQGLIIFFGSIAAITPYLAVILIGVIICWIIAAGKLNKRFLALTTAQEPDIKPTEQPALEEKEIVA